MYPLYWIISKGGIFMKDRGPSFFKHIHKILVNINCICHVYSHNILVSVFWGTDLH